RRMAAESPGIEEEEIHQNQSEDEDALNLFACQDQQQQILIAARLAERNIRPFLSEIEEYLAANDGQPFFKTMLLNVLAEHGIEHDIKVSKLGKSASFNPSELFDMQDHPQLHSIIKILSTYLEHQDPVLFDNVKSLIARHYV